MQFYIADNGSLVAIWYKFRSHRYVMGPDFNYEISHDFRFEPAIAVRATTLRRGCDKSGIRKVRYVYTEEEAKATIYQRIHRHDIPEACNMTDLHIAQLLRAPLKYVYAYFEWLGKYLPDDVNEMSDRLFRVYHQFPQTQVHKYDDLEELFRKYLNE